MLPYIVGGLVSALEAETKRRKLLFSLFSEAKTAFNESQKTGDSIIEVHIEAEEEILKSDGRAWLIAVLRDEKQVPYSLRVSFSVKLPIELAPWNGEGSGSRSQLQASFGSPRPVPGEVTEDAFVPMVKERNGEKIEITRAFENLALVSLVLEMNRQGITHIPEHRLNKLRTADG